MKTNEAGTQPIGLLILLILCLMGFKAQAQTTPSAQIEEQLQRLREAVQAKKNSERNSQDTSQTARGDLPFAAAPEAFPQTRSQQETPATTPLPPTFATPSAAADSPQASSTQTVPDTGASNLHEEAFLGATNSLLPMSPEQIRALHALFVSTQRAAAEQPGVPPLPTSTSINVNLSPGATPPVVRLSAGYVTSLVFVDSTGAPWPIKAYSIGNPEAFNVQWDKKSNLILIQSITAYKNSNLVIVLKDLNTPVSLSLMPGQRALDYRVDLRLPGLGPNAKTEITGLPGKESPYLLDVLNGIPPKGSQRLKVTHCSQCELWKVHKHFYLRTPYTLISPGWISKLSSADGTHAYELNQTPVLLMSVRGQLITLAVEGL